MDWELKLEEEAEVEAEAALGGVDVMVSLSGVRGSRLLVAVSCGGGGRKMEEKRCCLGGFKKWVECLAAWHIPLVLSSEKPAILPR